VTSARRARLWATPETASTASRDLYEQHGETGLQEISRKQPNPKNWIDPAVEEAVVALAIEYPVYGQLWMSNELKEQGAFVSLGSGRYRLLPGV
jgi:hypothetical protein